jgi:hypothetical protein
MKNKFLIFSLTLSFALLVFLIYPQVSFAAISVETLDAAAGKTSAILNATATSDELYDIRGFNLGTASAAGGEYGLATSSETGGPWSGAEISFSTTTNDTWESLTKGKVYYFRAYVASSTDSTRLTYGDEKKFLTGIDNPTSLTRSGATGDSISLSWTKGAGAENTIVRYKTDNYPTSISDGSLFCKNSGTSCTLSNLSCGSYYYFRAWSSTSDAGLTTTSDAYTSLYAKTYDCPGRGYSAPIIYDDSLVINQGAETTQSREVELTLRVGNTAYMVICHNQNFIDCPLEDYVTSKTWTLTEGDGFKIIYARFVSPDGVNSDIVSATITLETPVPVEEEVAEEVPEEEEVVEEEVVEEVPEEAEEEVVEEVTTAEGLRAQIKELQSQLIDLLKQLIQALKEQINSLLAR